MELIKKTSRRMVSNRNYKGVCHGCNSPISFEGETIAVEVEDTKDYWIVVPIDEYFCPYCGEHMTTMAIYKNLEISKELLQA